MKSMLLASVAVISLIAVTDAALAQAMNQGGTKEAPPAAAQKSESAPAPAPAPKAAVTQSTAPASKPGAVVEEKVDPKSKPQQAQDKTNALPEKKAAGDVKTDSKPSAATTTPAASSTAKDTKAPAADTKASTTGSAASASTGAAAAPPAAKQAQIASAIKQEKVQAVTNVNFSLNIGVAVPSSVRFYPLPSRIVEIYPEWRGYDFILVNGRYIILRPSTHEIVYIIEG